MRKQIATKLFLQSRKLQNLHGMAEPPEEPVSKNKRYRKPKPWDTDDVDHVSVPHFHSTCTLELH